MNNKLPFLYSAFVLIIIYSLASCTTYKPVERGITGGYSDTPTDSQEVVRTTFYGNGVTSRIVINDLALMRVADIAIQRGYSHFYLLSNNQQINTSINTYVTNNTVQVQSVDRATTNLVAILTNGTSDELSGLPFYDARETYNEGYLLNERLKFWNYTQLGYSISNDLYLGFNYGFAGGWGYISGQFDALNYDSFKGDEIVFSVPWTASYIGIEFKPEIQIVGGIQIPIIENYIYLPIGAGLGSYRVLETYDDSGTTIYDSSYITTEKFIFEVGLMARYNFLFAHATARYSFLPSLSYS
jgi:hypothetical protein